MMYFWFFYVNSLEIYFPLIFCGIIDYYREISLLRKFKKKCKCEYISLLKNIIRVKIIEKVHGCLFGEF